MYSSFLAMRFTYSIGDHTAVRATTTRTYRKESKVFCDKSFDFILVERQSIASAKTCSFVTQYEGTAYKTQLTVNVGSLTTIFHNINILFLHAIIGDIKRNTFAMLIVNHLSCLSIDGWRSLLLLIHSFHFISRMKSYGITRNKLNKILEIMHIFDWKLMQIHWIMTTATPLFELHAANFGF